MRTTALTSLLLGLAALLHVPAHAQSGEDTPGRNVAPETKSKTADMDGLWCGAGPLREFSLRLRQSNEDVEGELARKDRVRTIEGRVDGNVLRTQATKVGSLVLEKRGEELKVTGAEGALALVRGTSFRRAEGASCTG
ncbi:hypothetical protein [Ramlibacter humi]|uniref:Uncharacterized protein n=1 Tax=Ramlibacter humi TaxID=2530451 RepID=A0A4Z0BQT1_9BURK|nr:hypothetical protein [Ramlibacter humi]TFZ00349.1 hypothetical protein EZ216_14735 [Ramlibacter humi]